MYETGLLLAAAHSQEIFNELPAEPPYADWRTTCSGRST
jgi:hypothetical protein